MLAASWGGHFPPPSMARAYLWLPAAGCAAAQPRVISLPRQRAGAGGAAPALGLLSLLSGGGGRPLAPRLSCRAACPAGRLVGHEPPRAACWAQDCIDPRGGMGLGGPAAHPPSLAKSLEDCEENPTKGRPQMYAAHARAAQVCCGGVRQELRSSSQPACYLAVCASQPAGMLCLLASSMP